MAPLRARRARAGYQAGRETRDAIVGAAEAVLVAHGHSQFTLKRVADGIGISVGNLNYHFPSRDALLEALIERTLAEYSTRFANLIDRGASPAKEVLGKVLDWVIEDSTSERYSHLFRELWAMALHNRSIARAMEHFYARSIDDVVELLESSAPRVDRRELRMAVYLICSISEGCTVLFGTAPTSRATLGGVKRLARSAVESLAASWDFES